MIGVGGRDKKIKLKAKGNKGEKIILLYHKFCANLRERHDCILIFLCP